jgi:hypothetical protein
MEDAEHLQLLEATGVVWTYLGEVGSLPSILPGMGGMVSVGPVFTYQTLGVNVNAPNDDPSGVAVVDVSALINGGCGTAGIVASADVDNDGAALVDAHSQVHFLGMDGQDPVTRAGNAQGYFDSIAGDADQEGDPEYRSGWRTYADGTSAHSGFDDGLGIGPNGTPATLGSLLMADGLGYPRWAAQTADVGAAGTPEQIIAAMRASGLMAQTAIALAFAQDPTAALTNAVIAPPVTVQLLDDLGNVCTHDNTTEITVALTVPGGATLGGTLIRTAVAGVATFDDLAVDIAATYTMTATSGALTPDVSASFVISAP